MYKKFIFLYLVYCCIWFSNIWFRIFAPIFLNHIVNNCTIFLDSTYVLIYDIYFSLSDLLHCV